MSLFTQRHNAVLNVVAAACEEKGYDVTIDQTVRSDLSNSSLRPDLAKYDDDASILRLVDVKCPYSGQSFGTVHDRNVSKYAFYHERRRRRDWTVSVDTIIVSTAGLIPTCTKRALQTLGFDSRKVNTLLEDICFAQFNAGYALRKTLTVDRPARDRMHPRAVHRSLPQ